MEVRMPCYASVRYTIFCCDWSALPSAPIYCLQTTGSTILLWSLRRPVESRWRVAGGAVRRATAPLPLGVDSVFLGDLVLPLHIPPTPSTYPSLLTKTLPATPPFLLQGIARTACTSVDYDELMTSRLQYAARRDPTTPRRCAISVTHWRARSIIMMTFDLILLFLL